ncbi:MAG: energy transducer TonB [Candidatus Rokubacteria bacterium]|nr:energy transducer TonB [Candidatus Rokubacteria bacterium]
MLGPPSGTERSAALTDEPSRVDGPDGRQARESEGGGIAASGPMATLAPSAREGGQGVAEGLVGAVPSGGEGGIQAEFGPYLAGFRRRIQESLHYPPAARRRGLGGTVQLEIELLPTGKVASVVVRSSSSHAILDEAALDSVTRLSPVPFPPGLAPRPLKVRLPIVFELQ